MQCFFTAISHTLLHSLWQMAAVVGVLYLLLQLEGKRNPALRYAMAIGALMVICAWAIGTFWEEYYVAESTAHSLLHFSAYGTFIAHLPENGLSWWAQLTCWASRNASAIAGLWLMGSTLSIVRFVGGYWLITRTQQRYLGEMAAAWQPAAQQLAQRMGIRRPVALRLCPHISVPMVMGVIRPVILLPASLVSGMSHTEIQAIVAHELAHILRHDVAINLLLSFTDALFFFHPAYWWLIRQIRTEREHACDDIAIAYTTNRMVYARTLATVEAFALQSACCASSVSVKKPLALHFNGHRPCLLPRIQRIFISETNHFYSMKRMLSTSLLVSAIAIGIWVQPSDANANTPLKSCNIGSITMAIDSPPPPMGIPPIAPPPPPPPPPPNRHITVDADGDGTPEVDIAYDRAAINRQSREAMERAHMELQRARAEIQQEMLRIRREGNISIRERERICEDLRRAQAEVEQKLNSKNFERDWENFGRDMERWGEEMGRWGEQFGREMERWGENFEREMEEHEERSERESAEIQKIRVIERTLREELERDGLIKAHQRIEIEFLGDDVMLNGTALPKDKIDKYRGLIDAAAE